jgi:hypothetical protein
MFYTITFTSDSELARECNKLLAKYGDRLKIISQSHSDDYGGILLYFIEKEKI